MRALQNNTKSHKSNVINDTMKFCQAVTSTYSKVIPVFNCGSGNIKCRLQFLRLAISCFSKEKIEDVTS